MKGLARDRSKRYESFAQMRNALLPIVAPKEEVASIRRRVLAMLIDSVVISTLVAIILLSLWGPPNIQENHPLLNSLAGSAVSFLYLFLFEGLFSTTLGKRLVRLRVFDADDGGKPRIRNVALRVGCYLLCTNASEMLYFAIFGKGDFWMTPLVAWTGPFIGYAILLLPWWKYSPRRMTHEWVSRTETRLTTYQATPRSARLQQQVWQPELTHEAQQLESIGRFTLLGKLPTRDGTCWYQAEDRSLEREVWVQIVPIHQTPLSQSRRDCVRRTRMRVIESGQIGKDRWDAYLAPQGAPLVQYVRDGNSLPWPIARHLFDQILQEDRVEDEERLEQSLWSLSRIWVDELGRMTWVEAEIIDCNDDQPRSMHQLLKRVAQLALPGKHRLRKALPESLACLNRRKLLGVEELPTYRSLQFLERAAKGECRDGADLAKELAKLDQSPSTVSGPMRLTHSVAVHALLLPVLFTCYFVVLLSALVAISQVRRELQRLVTFQHMQSYPEKYQKVLEPIDEATRTRWMSETVKAEVDQAVKATFARSKYAYANVGPLERFMLDQMRLGESDDTGYDQLPFADQMDDAEKAGRRTDKPKTIKNVKVNNLNIVHSKSSFQDMTGSLDHWRRNQHYDLKDRVPIMQFVLYPMLVFVIWSTITRGGLTQYFTGLAILRRDGSRFGFLGAFFRAVLLCLPYLIVTYAIYRLELGRVDQLHLTLQLKRALLFFPLAYMILALLKPQLGPLEKLTYSAIVPR